MNAAIPMTEPPRSQSAEWHRTIASIREMLARLEHQGDNGDDRSKGKQAKAAAWVSSLVERVVAAATSEIDAAVAQTRAEADVDMAQLQALVAHLQRELDLQRQDVARLQQRLEAEAARSARLSAAVEAVQRLVSFNDPPDTERRSGVQSEPLSVPPARSMAVPANPPVLPPLTLAGRSHPDAGTPNPELTEYVRQAFETIETAYWADLRDALGPADIVDRLTENLRRAYDMFGRRVPAAGGSTDAESPEATLFEQQLTALLDSKAETSFGRHLAVAAYNYATPQTKARRGAALHAEAS